MRVRTEKAMVAYMGETTKIENTYGDANQTKRRQEKKEENSRHRRFDVYLSTGFPSELAGAAEGAPALETPDAPPIEAPLKRRCWRLGLVGVTAAGRFL